MKLGNKKLTVIGKEWFDKVNGNSYCSVRIYSSDKLLVALPIDYGYGDYYLQYATQWLLDEYAEKHKVKTKYYRELFSVRELITGCKKRDVKEWGMV